MFCAVDNTDVLLVEVDATAFIEGDNGAEFSVLELLFSLFSVRETWLRLSTQ